MPEATAQHSYGTYLWAMAIAVSFLLLFRTTGLHPTVFADEYTYSKFARLVALEEASIPGYLFLATYGVTSLCGESFLACARLLNIAFFVSAAPFIYLIGRKVAGEGAALLIALLSVLGPINSYTAYFMPESLYFVSFWAFTHFALSIDKKHSWSQWALMGTVFGISALVKPHALFLLPSLIIYFFLVQYRFAEGKLRAVAYDRYLAFFASAIGTKLAIGFLLAGMSGLTLFGAAYSSVALKSIGGMDRYVHLADLAAQNLFGHVVSLSLLFAVPMASLLLSLSTFLRHGQAERASINIAQYALLVLALLLGVVAAFTASVSGSGPYESNVRLHMRYYNFAFPLLLLVAGSQLPLKLSNRPSRRSRAVVGLLLGATICYAVYTKLAPYVPSLVDNPELRGFTYNSTVFHVLGGASLLSLALWVYNARLGAACFVYLFMPLAVCSSSFYVNQELRQRLAPDVFDRAGAFTKRYLPNEDISKLLVVGSDHAGLFRALFYLDNADASHETIPKGGSYDPALSAGKEWILLVGDHSLTKDPFYQLTMNGFTLARTGSSGTIDFRKASWPGVISSARGLSSVERWGTWSTSDVVSLEFAAPLPERFSVHLKAQAFGPNAGERLVAQVGDRTVEFRLQAEAEEQRLDFVNPGGSRVLRFHIPSPISPKELGLSNDERRLGVGFIDMRIAPQ